MFLKQFVLICISSTVLALPYQSIVCVFECTNDKHCPTGFYCGHIDDGCGTGCRYFNSVPGCSDYFLGSCDPTKCSEFAHDAKGCLTCECNEMLRIGKACNVGMDCVNMCPHGYVIDADGCSTCTCKTDVISIITGRAN